MNDIATAIKKSNDAVRYILLGSLIVQLQCLMNNDVIAEKIRKKVGNADNKYKAMAEIISENLHVELDSRLLKKNSMKNISESMLNVMVGSPDTGRASEMYDYRKHSLYRKQKGICPGCKMKFLEKDMEIDHIIACGRGGADTVENQQLLCKRCNEYKNESFVLL